MFKVGDKIVRDKQVAVAHVKVEQYERVVIDPLLGEA
jgi:hypothetical protein